MISWSVIVPVHPRVGGELHDRSSDSSRLIGSSPRGRGTRPLQSCPPNAGRFIPAWAGNSKRAMPTRLGGTVHPRVGGELAEMAKTRSQGYGSSPRGRGTPRRLGLHECPRRFIPAWAGNSERIRALPLLVPVHPRVGGELLDSVCIAYDLGGSSPRGRGTRVSASRRKHRLRFIPAWAGNSLFVISIV